MLNKTSIFSRNPDIQHAQKEIRQSLFLYPEGLIDFKKKKIVKNLYLALKYNYLGLSWWAQGNPHDPLKVETKITQS